MLHLTLRRCAAHHWVVMHGISGPSHQQQSLKCSYPLKLAVKKIQLLKCDWQLQLFFRFFPFLLFLDADHGLVCHMSYMRKDLGNVPQLGASDWPNTYQWILSDSAQPWAEGNGWVGETPGSFDLLPSVCSIYQQTINPATFSILLLCETIFFLFPLFASTHAKKKSDTLQKKNKCSPWHFIQTGVLCNELQSLVCISLYMFMIYLCSKLQCHLLCLFYFSLVSIVHDGLHVVSWEKPGDAVADSFKPAVIIFLDYIDDGSFHEGQLVLLVLAIVIDGHNWKKD